MTEESSPIVEHAVLQIRPHTKEDFEAAFRKAVVFIQRAKGCLGVRLLHGKETLNRYVLLVEWESLDDHVHGFRGSEDYEKWRVLLHHFYDPFPVVEHFYPVSI